MLRSAPFVLSASLALLLASCGASGMTGETTAPRETTERDNVDTGGDGDDGADVARIQASTLAGYDEDAEVDGAPAPTMPGDMPMVAEAEASTRQAAGAGGEAAQDTPAPPAQSWRRVTGASRFATVSRL